MTVGAGVRLCARAEEAAHGGGRGTSSGGLRWCARRPSSSPTHAGATPAPGGWASAHPPPSARASVWWQGDPLSLPSHHTAAWELPHLPSPLLLPPPTPLPVVLLALLGLDAAVPLQPPRLGAASCTPLHTRRGDSLGTRIPPPPHPSWRPLLAIPPSSPIPPHPPPSVLCRWADGGVQPLARARPAVRAWVVLHTGGGGAGGGCVRRDAAGRGGGGPTPTERWEGGIAWREGGRGVV